MLTRRTLLKRGGYAVAATALPTLMRTARAQTANFDYYIGPSGSDSNPGTQSSPWSITALNTKRSVYAGKNVGLLPGTYNCYSLCQAGSFNQPALAVNGGPSASNPTLIAAVTPRTAILTGANPSGGGYPSNECGIIGQGQYGALPPNPGNVIIDGLYITRACQQGISFYFAGPSGQSGQQGSEGGYTGIEIRNCEIYDIGGNDNDNVGGIFFQGVTGAWVHNNKIHGIQPPTNGQNPDDVACIFSYYSHSNIYEYNTLYDCNNAVFDKYFPNGNHTFRYNYVECAGLSPQNGLHGCSGGQSAGDTTKIYNNVLKCPSANLWDGSLGGGTITQSCQFYNNTCQFGSGQTGISYPAGSGSVSFKHYNNVYIPPVSTGEGVVNVARATLTSDYNNYGGASGSVIVLSSASYTFAQAQGAGYDTHSVNTSARFNSTGTLAVTGYQIVAGSPGSASGSNPGRVGGVSGGATCDMGAWGGANPPSQLGCNFGPVPEPPVIISIT